MTTQDGWDFFWLRAIRVGIPLFCYFVIIKGALTSIPRNVCHFSACTLPCGTDDAIDSVTS